ncbi:hypothetical protein BHE90_007221 [Fusarium euwallaceae]|uniref:Prion-inhibition and propagation HeLo domain-containing protein n=2 Tax=Fusarium solani species complex TaxID=232080 RepID=A0A3M2SKV8_9HYPO|nr:hypothetical protein CDV36_002137 [Fusarium kuroshium]RTE78314.1 hypothetical protein BHE90_007221 [Fusarium euwallaceae]
MAEFIVIGPILSVSLRLIAELGISMVGIDAEVRGLDLIAKNVEDDIEDAVMFYDKFAKYGISQELKLRQRALQSINKTKEALKMFRQQLRAHGNNQTLSVLLGDRIRVRKLVEPLQATQAQLARRVDWMRATLSDLEKNFDPSKEKEGLASSVPPNERPGWVETED